MNVSSLPERSTVGGTVVVKNGIITVMKEGVVEMSPGFIDM